MSQLDCIINVLGLEDKNISVDTISPSEEINGKQHVVIYGTLSYEPDSCPVCGALNKDHSVIKHGSKMVSVRVNTLAMYPAVLRLKKQRFLCKHCGHTFSAKTPIVQEHCSIATISKLRIQDALRSKVSEKDIASSCFVSTATVSRIIDKAFKAYRPSFASLPEHLCFDEFKSTKEADGSMSFIMVDATTHELVDIVENRQLPFLKRYFNNYSLNSRKAVKTISIDIYKPYISLIEELFPNAKIIIDRFHLVQMMVRSLQSTRIQVMKRFKKDTMPYKRLKRYWKLLAKPIRKVDDTNHHHWTHFTGMKSARDVVRECLQIDDILKETYVCYQQLRDDLSKSNANAFFTHINQYLKSNISNKMKDTLHTFKKYKNYITNTLKNPNYTNGVIEGTNNYIKTLKRIAFGYKSFVRFKTRILICQNKLRPIA